MSEEKKTPGASVEAPVVEPKVNDATTPAKEEDSVDRRVKEILGDIPASEEEEKLEDKKPEAKQPVEKKEGETPEKKIEESEAPEKEPKEAPKETTPQPRRIDRRIAKLYLSNLLLKGTEGEIPDAEQIAIEMQNYSLEDKQKALRKLLAENKSLRGGKDDGVVDLSEEDHEAIVEAKAEEMFKDMQGEIQEREWKDDLIATVDAHPELDERKNEYNSKLAIAVEKLVKKGMKASDVYQLVTESISTAKDEQKKEEEIEKQKALSGAVSASNDNVEPKGDLTWEDEAKKMEADPNYVNSEEYLKMVKGGKLPKK